MTRRPGRWLTTLFRTPRTLRRRDALLNMLLLEDRLTPATFTGPMLAGQAVRLENPAAMPFQVLPAIPDSPVKAVSYFADRLASATPFALDNAGLREQLAAAPAEYDPNPIIISLPTPGGAFQRFRVWEAQLMEPGLAAQLPAGTRTYRGQGIDDPAATLAADTTMLGFHTQVLSPNGSWFIDPYYHLDQSTYISYLKADLAPPHDGGCQCQLCAGAVTASRPGGDGEDTIPDKGPAGISLQGPTFNTSYNGNLRTLRAAVAATGEYTAFFGGTAAAGQSAIVTTMNRVSGVYEVEVSVRMTLVANNINIVYTDAGTDPYTNVTGSAALTTNQSNVDAVIGSANYDIGHLVATGSGGVASLGVVGINGSKARGTTGRPSPTGDPFDIDYVAHEMGHQFGGNHTFNTSADSNRNASTAYEPGSGSTIMAYAGITGDDLQNNSDAYFHVISLAEIFNHVNSTIPGVGTNTANGNSAPTANAGPDYAIPANTPFALTGTGTDANGDALTYNWEQYDLGAAQLLTDADNGASPLFRSWTGTTNPTRTFPRLSNLLANTVPVGEKLPTVARSSMDFTLTVRDNRSGGGAFKTDDMVVNVVNTGAAFTLTAPNTAVSWTGGTSQSVTWNVAGTTAAPINASLVNILLSTDGGNTFPTVIASNVANDGSETVVIPNTPSTQARIKVQPVNNIFFDLSNVNFTITAGSAMQVTSSSPASGGMLAATAGVATMDLTFSLPVNAATIGTGDITVSTGSVTGAALQSANVVRYTIGGLTTETALTATLLNGAVAATTGETNGATVLNYSVDQATSAVATPLASVAPAGSLAYSGTAAGSIQTTTDTDSFTINLEAGQRLAAVVTPAAGLRPRVTITGPGATNATASAGGAGALVSLSGVNIATAGVYTITVDSLASTTGTYSVQLLLNAAAEAESNGGPANSTQATAQALTLSTIGGTSVAGVRGVTDAASGGAVAEAEPNDAYTSANGAASSFSAASTNLYQFGITGNLSTGTDVDFFNIGNLDVGDVITITMYGAGAGGGTLVDAQVALYRGTTQVAFDDDNGVNAPSSAYGDSIIHRFTVTTAGAHSIRANRATTGITGTYTIGVLLENTGTAPTTGGTVFAESGDAGASQAAGQNVTNSWRAVTHTATATGTVATTADLDVFAYTLGAGDFLSLRVVTGGAADTKVRLLNSAGAQLLLEDGQSTGPVSDAPLYGYLVPTAGTYYVEVGAVNSTSGPYTLNMNLSPVTPPASPPAFDFYSLPLVNGQTVSFGLDATAAGTFTVDLLNPAGTVVASGVATGTTFDSVLNGVAVTADGTYALRVGGSVVTPYTLVAANNTILESEANDTFATAQNADTALRVQGQVGGGAEDWYSFSVAAGATLTLATATPGDAAGEFANTLNPRIELYSPSNALVAADANSAVDGRNAALSYAVPAAGTYYARVLAESGTAGEYALTRGTASSAVATGFTVNAAASQRSRITTLEVTFSGPVTAADFNTLGAIQLKRTAVASVPTGAVNDIVQTGPAAASHITVAQGAANTLVLTFDNNGFFSNAGPGVEYGSLTDGHWQLIIGGYSSTVGDLNLRRLYGDSTVAAGGVVDIADLTAFGNAFNGANLAFDFDNNNVVNTADLTAFGNRFNSTL